jgi:DNA-binding CsgD family transcriptional regulator
MTKDKKNFSTVLKRAKTFVVNTQIFKDSKLSVLENISYALKEKSLNLTEISSILNKSPKTIWTVLSRAEKKLKLSKNPNEKAGGVGK